MNNNNFLESRYSFNIAQGVPIAESTHLNGSGFAWGSVHPKTRDPTSLTNSPSTSSFNEEISTNAGNMHTSKIDARIAADVQSKGLASRIVKYQESGTRLNRSMSAHNLFSKPGQFPTVTLKKANLPYRAAKRELSMIRIPPPDKSSYYGNTVSSLLRSSSVIGLQSQQSEDLSTENKPIIHPPPTENDMAPTRSVLDVLKEISRKRINSDELESEETSKKYCSHRNDFGDSIANKNCGVQEKYLPRQRYKRQRDCITSQDTKLLGTKTSPEQAKKRICNYNNDITSSLSSSVKCKRIPTFQNNSQIHTIDSQLEDAQVLNDQHRSGPANSSSNNIDKRFKNLENNWKKLETFNNLTHSEGITHEQYNNAAAKNFVSETFYNTDEKLENNLTDAVDKPRLTLFNKKFDDTESEEKDKTYENELEEKNENDCTGIQFVKPKKITSNSGAKNPILERTQKSKLALMLSGLRGELYQNSDLDELDSSGQKEELKASVSNKTNTSTSASINSLPALTAVTYTTTITSASTAGTPTNVKTTVPPTTASPLVGLKVKSSENVSNTISTDTPKKPDLQLPSNIPAMTGFALSGISSNNIPQVSSLPKLEVGSKAAAAQTLTTPTTNSSTMSSSAFFTSNDKSNEISGKLQLPLNKTLIQLPAVSGAETTTSSNNKNTAITSNSLAVNTNSTFVSNLTNSKTDNSTLPSNSFPILATSSPISKVSSDLITFGTPTASTANPTNAFNFSIPSTTSQISTAASPAPVGFGVLPNPTSNTTTVPTIFSAVKSTAAEHKTIGSQHTNTGLLNFNTNQKPLTSEIEKCSGAGVPALSFNFDKNKTANSVDALGSNSVVNTNSIQFKFDAKNHKFGDQNNQKVENNSNSTTQFNAECLNTNAAESSISVFDNATRKQDNNIFNSSGLSCFGSKSNKAGAEVSGSNSNNKSEMLDKSTGYGNDKSKSMSFNFAPNTTTSSATSSSNIFTPAGGFSFSSAVVNSKESTPSAQTNIANHHFSSSSAATPQNNFAFGSSSNKLNSPNIFGVSTNKPENLSQGGFSFGSVTPLKTSTFTFGAEKTPKSDTTNTNNVSTGFSFVASPETKQNALPTTNTLFSFGSPQSVQQKQPGSNSTGNSFNIFGLTDASKTAQPAQPPAFNFTSGSVQTNVPANIFAPPALNVTTGPGDRPIRRATRRLQK